MSGQQNLYGKDVKYSCIKHAVQFCLHFDFFLCLGQVKLMMMQMVVEQLCKNKFCPLSKEKIAQNPGSVHCVLSFNLKISALSLKNTDVDDDDAFVKNDGNELAMCDNNDDASICQPWISTDIVKQL